MKLLHVFAVLFLPLVATAQDALQQAVSAGADAVNDQVIEWRRDFHQHPELSNREFETGKKIAAYLNELGLKVETGVAKTGVIGLLETGKPGPTVALRADIDALPVTERVDVPFASKVKTTFLGQETGVMHACGHDTHTAMLMGAAKILTGMKDQLKGRIVFIFQPAEEGAPPGEEGGAKLMVDEGVLKRYEVDVIFGQHIGSYLDAGKIMYKPAGTMAAANRFTILVEGKQTHGSQPWSGVDPVTVSAQIILGLQTIVSRQMELTKEAAVISVGKITGGVRNNIIPESVEMVGTIRTLDKDMQTQIFAAIERMATNIAEASGAKATVEISPGTLITYNDLELTAKAVPTLYQTAGEDNVILGRATTGAEDFSFFANEVPGFFYFLGGKVPGSATFAPHHTPDFYIDESGLKLGVKTISNLAINYLMNH